MNQIEEKLHKAAEEVRQTARHAIPPGFEATPRKVSPAWLAFAAAFVVVLVALGIGPLLGGPGPNSDVAAPSITTSSTIASTTTIDVPAQCSATGVPTPGEPAGLPDAVAATRAAMIAAASRCDLDALGDIAASDLNTSFGGGGFQNIRDWEESGRGELGTLLALLGMPYAVQEFPDHPTLYVWPAAFDYDTWEEIPASDLEALLAIYSQEELDGIALFGSYAGWRIGITESGEWAFFVAGD